MESLKAIIENELEAHRKILESKNGWIDKDGIKHEQVEEGDRYRANGVILAFEFVLKQLEELTKK